MKRLMRLWASHFGEKGKELSEEDILLFGNLSIRRFRGWVAVAVDCLQLSPLYTHHSYPLAGLSAPQGLGD